MPNNMIDISVIIQVNNTEKYLQSCVDCVIEQLKMTVGTILINDGSKNTSSKSRDEFDEKSPIIKVLHIQNSGLATTKK